ncbi:hypothetical protein FI667_g5202, partial [Globisporangium splendens]
MGNTLSRIGQRANAAHTPPARLADTTSQPADEEQQQQLTAQPAQRTKNAFYDYIDTDDPLDDERLLELHNAHQDARDRVNRQRDLFIGRVQDLSALQRVQLVICEQRSRHAAPHRGDLVHDQEPRRHDTAAAIFFHTDPSQSIDKLRVDVDSLGVDAGLRNAKRRAREHRDCTGRYGAQQNLHHDPRHSEHNTLSALCRLHHGVLAGTVAFAAEEYRHHTSTATPNRTCRTR